MNRDVFKGLIALKQSEMPFSALPRDICLPIDGKEIVTVPGVRRCGKSTMMELAVNALLASGIPKERILWIGFDDERLARLSSDDLDGILVAYMEMHPDIPLKDVYLFFDELPLVDGWELFVLRVFKNYCKHVFVCGSNAHVLSKEMKSALRGWPHEVEAWPLSFREFCRFKGVDPDGFLEADLARVRVAFDEFNRYGGFPAPVLEKEISAKFRILQGYFDTMILRDFVEHWSIPDPALLRHFLKRVMGGIANPLSVNAIFNEVKSMGFKTAKGALYEWLGKACGIYLFLEAPKFSRSLAKERQALSKYYVVDNGLRTATLLAQADDDGKQLENTVFLHLFRNKGAHGKICHYRERQDCDFVVCRKTEVERLVQVSWSLENPNTRKREISGLLEAARTLSCSDLTVVTHDEEGELVEDGRRIRIVPGWKFCKE